MANVTNSVALQVKRSYMAVSHTRPVLGQRYSCYRIEKSNNDIVTMAVNTSIVEAIKPLSHNIYFVETCNSLYIVKILGFSVDNVHFAIVHNVPRTGSHLRCFKLDFNWVNYKMQIIPWETSTVEDCESYRDFYKVETRNSTYMCFPL